MKLVDRKIKDYNKEFYFDLGHNVKGRRELVVSVYHDATHKIYAIDAVPADVQRGEQYNTVRTYPFDGIKMSIKQVNRKSKKSFEKCIEDIILGDIYMLCLSVDKSITQNECNFIYDQIKENWS